MSMLLASALFFIFIHLGVAGTRLRDAVVTRLGPSAYMIAFSLASLIGVFWITKAYQAAPLVITWGMLEWWKPVAILLMLPAFVLIVSGLTTPNPTAVAQESQIAAEPSGIVRVTRHPFLVGVGLWAVVHIVGNGDLASAILFATFAVVAIAGTLSIDAKRRRMLGAERWDRFAAKTSILPFAAIAAGRVGFEVSDLVNWRLAAGLVAYALMLGGHVHIVGVSPFPA